MAQFFTDKYLKYRQAIRGDPIERDRPCERCGYNLRGLRFDGLCPECGAAIRVRRGIDDPFDELPVSRLRKLRLAALLAAVSLCGAVGARLLVPGPSGAAAAAVACALWVAAIWVITAPIDEPYGVSQGFGPDGALRRAARWLQLGWIVHGVAGITLASFGLPPVSAAGLLWAGGWLIGMAGVVVVAILLSRLAGWIRDEFAMRAFDLAVLGTTCGTALLVMVTAVRTLLGFGSLLVTMALIFTAGLLVCGLLAFPVGLVALGRSLHWSVLHASTRVQRKQRLAARMAPRRPPPPPAASVPPGQ